MEFYSRQQVLDRTTWSVATLYRQMRLGLFPRPVRISAGRVVCGRGRDRDDGCRYHDRHSRH